MESAIISFVYILSIFGVGQAIECYNCRRSINSGCDFQIDSSLVGSTTISCSHDCYTELTTSAGSSTDYEIDRGCSVTPVCTNTSYSVSGQTKLRKCCSGETCNYDITQDIFQCYECSDTESETSTCKETGYRGSTYGSFSTSYCTKYCEKRVKVESGVKTVSRSCQDSCGMSFEVSGFSTEILCCQGDLCNSGLSIHNVTMVQIYALSACVVVGLFGVVFQL